MGLETVTNIDDLVVTNPLSTDARSQGDDHIRNIKLALKTDLPNITGVMTATQAELNVNTGVTGGTVTASKTVVVDASSKVDVWNVDNLVFNGNDISSTSADIDLSPTTNVTMPSDTAKFVMGAGDDASLNFDGTNLIILTDGAGASGIILDSEDDTFELKGSGVLQATFDTAGLNLVTGDAYYIAGTSVLNATTLGTAVVTSSLTTVGALGSGSISSGFGAIDIGSSALSTTGTITGPSGTWDVGGMDIATTDSYAIAGTDVLVAATLGTGVLTSSLTTVGALNSGSITSGFGAIDNGASAITTTGTITGGVVVADNININGNTIISTDTAGDINITPDTTGDLVLDGVKWPQADGSANQILVTDGAAQTSWATPVTTTALTTHGDILFRNASALARLGAGTNGEYLQTQGAGADPVWAAVVGTDVTTKGDLQGYSTVGARKGVGADDTVLIADDTDPTGIVWGNITNLQVSASAGIVRTKLATPGAWILIGTNVASTTAALTQTGLDSTYDTYAVVISDLVPAADGESLRMTVGDSGGLDVGASDYSYHNNRTTHASGTYAGVAAATNANCTLSGACGNAAGEGYGGILYIHRPGDGTMQPTFSWHGTSVTDTTVGLYGAGSGKRNAVIALDRVSIFFNSGNIATGRMSVFGISHT
jgi:hypothetical protein